MRRETRIAFERLNTDANAIRAELTELRTFGDYLVQGYTRLGEIARRTDERSEATAAAVAAIETERSDTLGQAEEAIRRLERRAGETTVQLEQRLDELDARKQSLERAATEAATILGSLEGRVALFTKRDSSLAQSEAIVRRLERRIADAQLRLDEVVRRDKEIRAANPSRMPGWTMRPFARAGAVLGALVVSALLGFVILRTREHPQPNASNIPSAHRDAPASVVPITSPRDALADTPTPRPAATTGSIGNESVSSINQHNAAGAVRTAPTVGAARPDASANQTIQYYFGALTLESEPAGSVVFLDQREVGRTPLAVKRIRAGSHVVRIERTGYDRWTNAVLVTADRETRVRARLQAAQ